MGNTTSPAASQPSKTNTPIKKPPQGASAKSASPKTAPQKTATTNSKNSVVVDSSAFQSSRLDTLFNKYKDEEDQIGPTGIETYCSDLGVDPEDVVMIVLAYHLKCKEMGFFARDEFLKGFEALGCDTLDKMKAQLPKLKKDLEDPPKFQAIYKYAFQFAREGEQKCIGVEIAQGLLNLLLVERYPIAKSFVEFLKAQEQYKVLNADQWASLLEFCKLIHPDFSNYDENGAWPCILDEWVDWVKHKDERCGDDTDGEAS